MLTLALRALLQLGRRGIILAGWAGLQVEQLDELPDADAASLKAYAKANVLVLNKSAPHEWLFPQCDAIVHHGGAGTTASAMRSGVPSVITPCFCDQPELAAKVQNLGAGVALKQFQGVTAKDLAAALKRALYDDKMRDCARELGEALRAEDGAAMAAADICGRLKNPRRESYKEVSEDSDKGDSCINRALDTLELKLAWRISKVTRNRKSSIRSRSLLTVPFAEMQI